MNILSSEISNRIYDLYRQNQHLDYLNFNDINRFNITGTSKDDSIDTNNGNDIINSGAGNDRIGAGGGRDMTVGGAGNDTLTGGLGADRFTFNVSTEGIDTITDFTISQTDLRACKETTS